MPNPFSEPKFQTELASKRSNLRYSTVIELLTQGAYVYQDVETLLADTDKITQFVFEPFDELVTSGDKVDPEQVELPFEGGMYL
jgi:hypothetical protein